MSPNQSLWQRLSQLKDEISLQVDLMSMDLRDEWNSLLERFVKLERELEQKLIVQAKTLGEAEESFFVGNKSEIEQLINDFSEIKRKQNDA